MLSMTLKTQVDERIVHSFLKQFYHQEAEDLLAIHGGEFSQAFSFTINGEEYVIRIHKDFKDFEKDKYASDHFRSTAIPIPEVTSIGKVDTTYFYAIAKKAEGKNLDTMDKSVTEKFLPELMRILDIIHAVDISNTNNFGDWDKNGNAKFTSWKDFILSIDDEEYFNWSNLFKTTFLEKDVVERLYGKLKETVALCPEGRYLVHGDFGYSNVLATERNVTGVIDWGLSKYGDFLYDVAWLALWTEEIPYKRLFLEHYRSTNKNIAHFDERILCYMLHQGIGAFDHFAKSGNETDYQWAKERLLSFF